MTLTEHLQGMNEHSLILTGTERVARHLKMQAALLQSIAGKRTWFAKGKIATVTQWIEQLWLDTLPDEQLLHPVQELAVVKTVADRSGLLPDSLISSTGTARRISQAYSQFIKYKMPLDADRFRFKKEYEYFWQWRELIAAECKKNGCVFRAQLPDLVLQGMISGAVPLPERVVLVGLLYINPAEQAILDYLASQGVEVAHVEEQANETDPVLVRATTQAEEFEHVAEWVSGHLKPYIETPQAAPSIALLVPDVKAYQAPLIEALSMAVSPAALLPAIEGVETREPWDVSSGATLGSRPVIRAAMSILSLSITSADIEAFSCVLRSKWVGGYASESSLRALADIWLRDNQGMGMNGRDLLKALQHAKHTCPDFIARLSLVLEKQSQVEGQLFPSEWADFFCEALQIMGWAAEEHLSSENFQTLEAWDDALMLFRSLDYQLGGCSYERAYMWLREIIDTRQFQPRLSHVAPVSIMSYTDAVGLSFDHVWVLGATNQALPQPADPSPFLPIELLAAAGVPEATSDGQLERAGRIVKALKQTCNEVVFSAFEHDDRGSSQGATELLGPWPAPIVPQSSFVGFDGSFIGTLNRDQYDPEAIPQMDDEEISSITGGVSIFKNYAYEPFYAFACNRLRAGEFPRQVVGFDPRIQGTMVHLCLELFWKKTKTQAALLAMTEEELTAAISGAVQDASDILLNKLAWRFGRNLIKLEQGRLVSLLQKWMEIEKARTLPFEVVGFEVRTKVVVYGVPLTVTLDRIDRITREDKTTFNVLIDYKAGANFKFSSLNAGSLKEPQLPIYAVTATPADLGIDSIDGITLAQVNAKNMHVHTRSAETAHLVPGRGTKNDVGGVDTWLGQVAAWERTLSDMAHGLITGNGEIEAPAKGLPMGYEHLGALIK